MSTVNICITKQYQSFEITDKHTLTVLFLYVDKG